MTFAHTFGTGGPDVELLLVAVAVLALSLVFFFSKTTKPMVPVVLMLVAFAMGAGAFALGGSQAAGGSAQAPDGVDVSIASPAEGATVPAGEPITLDISLQGAELTSATESDDPRQGHLHVYVDDQLIAMPATPTPDVTLDVGEHTVAIEFTTADHRQFEPRIIDEISVTAGSL